MTSPRHRLRALFAGFGLLFILGSCQRLNSASGPWDVQEFYDGALLTSGDREVEYSWALFAKGRSRLEQIQRTESGAVARQLVVCYLAPEGDSGRWESPGSRSSSDREGTEKVIRLAYKGSEQGLNHERDLVYFAGWPDSKTSARLEIEEVRVRGRALPAAADLFVVVRATPTTLLSCEIDPAWPAVQSDPVGFLDAVCAAHADMESVLSFAR